MKTILTIVMLAIGIQLYSAPYNGNIMKFKQPDGTYVDVKLYGDEYYMRAVGLDNYTLIRDKNTQWICYAYLSDDGSELFSTGIVYKGRTGVVSTLKSGLTVPQGIDISDTSRDKVIAKNKALLNRNLSDDSNIKTTPVPVTGNIKGLCIVIDFSDEPATVPISEFNDFCNKLDYNNYGNNGSLRRYFTDISGGVVDYQNVVYGYFRAPNTFEYYDKLPHSEGAPQLLGWALNKLNTEGFDFSTLTTNPDGSITAINLMYTGVPQIWSEGLWWHRGIYPDFSADGVHSGNYNSSPANAPLILSTAAHENGHMIGKWPDTYKYTNFNGPDGIGSFDLMCWYGNEYNPVPPNPLFRSKAGWGTVVDVTNYNGLITDAANSLTCYKYQINNGDEFFLIESRRKTGRSTFIPDEGLTIWHIDRTGDNQTTHHEVYLEHANNDISVHTQACFHAGFNNEFGSSTSPGSAFYNGSPSGLRVRNISAVSDAMTYNVGVAGAAPAFQLSYQSITGDNNGNGFLEPGESGNINILAGNGGQSISGNANIVCTVLGSSGSYVTINTPSVNAGVINVNQTITATFNVSFNAGTPVGTLIDLKFTISDGIYSTYFTRTFIVGQQILMGNQQIATCSAMFYDAGGAFSNYDDMKDYITTISSSSANLPVKVEFLTFELEADPDCIFDYMKIYNGGSTSSPLIGTYCGTNSPGTITSTDPSGKLTFQFHSDVGWRYAGWSARFTVDPLIANAGTIAGNSTVCQNQSSVTYTVPAITNATSYVWTLPAGATGTSTTNSITVNYGSSAVSGNITVKGYNACGDGAASTLAITVNPLPATAGTITGAATVCQNQSSVTYTVPAIANATSYIWTLPSGATGTSTTNSITVNYGTSAVSGSITVKGHNSCGDGTASTRAITVNPLPASAGIITGAATVCQNQSSVTYTVPAIANATSYIWTLPSGATGTSTTNSITVNYGTSAVSGNITVKGHNSCGDGTASTRAVTVNPLPASAGIITGAATVCQNQSSVTYTVPAIVNATSYIWTLPSGATGTSTTSSITVNYGASAVSGNITVKGHNSCGDGAASTLAVTVNPLPAGAGTITGTATVCQNQSSVTYTVPAITNATSYIWTLPAGATGTSTTSSITVNYGMTAVSGNITVKGHNACGDGTASTRAITVNPLPAGAGTIAGTATVCQNQSSVTYNVPAITNATSYVWTLPSGTTGTSTTNSITVNYGTSAVSGSITVKGQNSCGDGAASTLAVTVNPLPAGAGTIAGAATVCQNQSSVTYSVPVIANATSYIWTLPTGATGTSTTNSITVNYGASAVSGSVTVNGHNTCGDGAASTLAVTVNPLPAGAGTIAGAATVCQNQSSVTYTVPVIANATSYIWTLPTGATGTSTTNSITVNYGAPAVSGSVTVKGHNDCGDGTASALAIVITPLTANAGTISGTTTVCQGQNSVTYTVPLIANATSYVWTLPSGATGTSTTNSITVNYGTSAVSGNISVKGRNDCGDGGTSTLAVTVNPKPVTPVVTLNANILHSNSSGGNQWYNRNLPISGATNQDYTYTVVGDYSVVVTINGCTSDPSTVNVITGLAPDKLNPSVKVYPNPVSDELILEFEGNTDKTEFVILNSAGQVVFTGNLFEKTVIQTTNYTPGLYFIKLKSGKTFEFRKILKL